MNLNLISAKLEIKYYKSIVLHLLKNNIQYAWLDNHLAKLKGVLLDDKLTETATETTVLINSDKNEQNNLKQSLLFSNDNLYKKPWTKLNSIHKIIKIKEVKEFVRMHENK